MKASALASDITAYFEDGADNVAALRDELASWPEVERLAFLDKDEVLKRLQERLGTQLPPTDTGNPLPAELQIWLRDPSTRDAVLEKLRKLPMVKEAVANLVDVEYWLELLRQSLRQA